MTYKVDLDIYNGPMDLLLYLIRREEVDIRDIPIARIADQYVVYLDLLKGLDIELAGDFIVMAATLLELKSRALLPRAPEPGDEEGAPEEDPRETLIRQLIEYRRFKEAAGLLSDRGREMACRFPRLVDDGRLRGLEAGEADAVHAELFKGIEVWDLFGAFSQVIKTLGYSEPREVVYDDTPVEEAARQLMERLETARSLLFTEVFPRDRSASYLVTLFLAILELMRQRRIGVEQKDDFKDIRIYLRDPATEEYAPRKPKGARESADALARRRPRRPTFRQRQHVEEMMEGVDLEKTEFDEILDAIQVPEVEAFRPLYSDEELKGEAPPSTSADTATQEAPAADALQDETPPAEDADAPDADAPPPEDEEAPRG
jgi:segregation and condensation protein A